MEVKVERKLKFVKNPFEYIFNFIKDGTADILSGLVFWLPIGIVILVGGYIYDNLEDWGEGFLVFFFPRSSFILAMAYYYGS